MPCPHTPHTHTHTALHTVTLDIDHLRARCTHVSSVPIDAGHFVKTPRWDIPACARHAFLSLCCVLSPPPYLLLVWANHPHPAGAMGTPTPAALCPSRHCCPGSAGKPQFWKTSGVAGTDHGRCGYISLPPVITARDDGTFALFHLHPTIYRYRPLTPAPGAPARPAPRLPPPTPPCPPPTRLPPPPPPPCPLPMTMPDITPCPTPPRTPQLPHSITIPCSVIPFPFLHAITTPHLFVAHHACPPSLP